jgi:hypothetical protein
MFGSIPNTSFTVVETELLSCSLNLNHNRIKIFTNSRVRLGLRLRVEMIIDNKFVVDNLYLYSILTSSTGHLARSFNVSG